MLLTSHLGRPKGKEDKYSLAPVADRLTELLGKKVTFVEDCIGDTVAAAVAKMGNGDVALLENGACLPACLPLERVCRSACIHTRRHWQDAPCSLHPRPCGRRLTPHHHLP